MWIQGRVSSSLKTKELKNCCSRSFVKLMQSLKRIRDGHRSVAGVACANKARVPFPNTADCERTVRSETVSSSEFRTAQRNSSWSIRNLHSTAKRTKETGKHSEKENWNENRNVAKLFWKLPTVLRREPKMSSTPAKSFTSCSSQAT